MVNFVSTEVLTSEGSLQSATTALGVLIEAVVNTAVIRIVEVKQLPNGLFQGVLVHTTA